MTARSRQRLNNISKKKSSRFENFLKLQASHSYPLFVLASFSAVVKRNETNSTSFLN